MRKIVILSVISVVCYYILHQLLESNSFLFETKIGNVNEYVIQLGYPLENHYVETEDGYILHLHRIPRGLEERKATKRPPVLFMHGLLSSSMDWIMPGPGKSLGLILADAGYDIWLGNNRGNTYSRNHTVLDVDNDKDQFFDYSYHEIGVYDLPAMIDKVLSVSGHKKLTYVGYSEGFTSFLVMGSIKPEYNDKILLMNALAPVTNMYNVTSVPLNLISRFSVLLQLAKHLNIFEMFTHRGMAKFLRLLCRNQIICDCLFTILGGSHQLLGDQNYQISILSNFPAGMSLKQITHYVQGNQQGNFAEFDYGHDGNLLRYGQTVPPAYDLSKVISPICIYYSEADNLVNIPILRTEVVPRLPNMLKAFLIPEKGFNHLDYLWARNMTSLLQEVLTNINAANKRPTTNNTPI